MMTLLPKKIFVLYVVMVLLGPCVSMAQVSFTAKISPGKIGKNETAELRLMVENAGRVESINAPALDDFLVLSGPNEERGMESINGVTRQYIGITYVLKPKSKGRITIGPATAKADGKDFRSNRVVLEVTNKSNNPANNAGSNISPFSGLSPFTDPLVQSAYNDYILRNGENVADKIDKNIFIRLDANKTTCYVGEPVVVAYKLYTRLKSESNIIKNPSFNGFSVIDLMPPGNNYYTIEKLNGREYNVYTLRKAQLYPLQAGRIELESAEVENNIHFIKEDYVNSQGGGIDNMFRDFAQASIPAEGVHDEKVTLQSKPAFITVNPLPQENKPALFSGAVGKFTIEAAIEKTTFTTDDAGKLRVVLSGEGNMTLINAPEVKWPAETESFDSKAREQLNKYAVPVSGIKVFEYPFSIPKAGDYTIEPVQFCYFDVKENSYKTISTKPFNIKVKAGSGTGIFSGKKNNGGDKRTFFDTVFSNRWLIIVPLFIFVIAGLFVWLKKDNRSTRHTIMPTLPGELVLVPAEQATNFAPLMHTEAKLISQDTKGFYETLNRDFRKYLAEKLKLPVETIDKKKIALEADKMGIPVTTCLQIQQLLDDVEWQLYTPFPDQDKMLESFNSADHIVQSLNKLIP